MRTRTVNILVTGLLLSASVGFCQFGERDMSVEGKQVTDLQRNILIHPIVDRTTFVSHPFAELERAWIAHHFLPETLPYYFRYETDKGITDGYCSVQSGLVLDTFVCTKDYVSPVSPKQAFPPTLQVDVQAEPTQPAGYPLFLTLTLTNKGDTPFRYDIYGPGEYFNAALLTAEFTHDAKQTKRVELANGQLLWGVGHSSDLAPGDKLTVPASAGVLPVGSYHIKIENAKPVMVTVKASAKLGKALTDKMIEGVRKNDVFMDYVVNHYNFRQVFHAFSTKEIIAEVRKGSIFLTPIAFADKIWPVLEALRDDLTSADSDVALRAAGTIQFYGNGFDRNLAAFFTPAITKTMHQQLDRKEETGGKVQLETMLAWIASEFRTQEAIAPVLDLLHSQTSGLDEESRTQVVGNLAEFPQEGATEELRHLLKDPAAGVRTTAAFALAERKDPAGIDVLIAGAAVQNPAVPGLPSMFTDAYQALLNFPDDPRVEFAIMRALESEDSNVRDRAKEAMENLQRIRTKQVMDRFPEAFESQVEHFPLKCPREILGQIAEEAARIVSTPRYPSR